MLMRMLSSESTDVLVAACGALHNLAVNDEQAQGVMTTEAAVKRLAVLMGSTDEDLRCKAVATVWTLACRGESQRLIGEWGAVPAIVALLSSASTDVVYKALGALRCLAICGELRFGATAGE
jgi:hypothetical protein